MVDGVAPPRRLLGIAVAVESGGRGRAEGHDADFRAYGPSGIMLGPGEHHGIALQRCGIAVA
jgi:hypothetical protein